MDLPRSEFVTRLGDSPENQKSWELRPTEADMILLIPENDITCLADWRLGIITANAMPPRDPNDDDDDEEEEKEDEEGEDLEPPVVREPDPDE
jgi:hypothetical protein